MCEMLLLCPHVLFSLETNIVNSSKASCDDVTATLFFGFLAHQLVIRSCRNENLVYCRGELSDDQQRPVKCLITATGMVTYYTMTIHRVSCALQLFNFPFDEQLCSLWFGSWTYNSTELDIFAPGAEYRMPSLA